MPINITKTQSADLEQSLTIDRGSLGRGPGGPATPEPSSISADVRQTISSERRCMAMIAVVVFTLVLNFAHTVQIDPLAASTNLGAVKRADGLRLSVSGKDAQPVVDIALPGHSESDCAIEVIFPEHVTARRHGDVDAEHLYLFKGGPIGARPPWRRIGNSLEYQRELSNAVHMLARVTLESDGLLFHYEFTNGSDRKYDMIYAVTDPRLKSVFHDVRLERTYVHHSNGFDLLASETPARLTLPLEKWLPARYLASFTWPVPLKLVERRNDGITYYNKSRKVDEPLIATLSLDRTWVVASFTRETGNVWSNPELTCQHVDPQVPLPGQQKATMEVKMLVLRGSLDEAHRRMLEQRNSLK